MNLEVYNVGDTLVFVGESTNFRKNQQYRIKEIQHIDFDELDCFYYEFENWRVGCYDFYLKANFVSLSKLRENKLNKVLK